MAALGHQLPPLPRSWWGQYMPPGHVLLFSAHGGAGKSTISTMLSVCLSMGIDFLGLPTRRANVLYFSAEDPASLVLRRMQKACLHMGVDPNAVRERLHLIDATEGHPELFTELRVDGVRRGMETSTYEHLRQYIEEHEIDVVIVDNSSDVFNADEINRSLVRAFMRSLALLVRARGGSVVLLAHVDKTTARSLNASGDSYSGSTAWHNSARTRAFLRVDKDGALTLVHEKNNLGPREPDLQLEWPKDSLPQLVHQLSGPVQRIQERNELKAVLGLMHEFISRGEYIGAEPSSHSNAGKLLEGQRGYPKGLKRPALFDLLRDAERDGLIARSVIRTPDRKSKQAWTITAKGCELIGLPLDDATATAEASA
jgi:archaellum biogenesis ATPase FlaH